MMKHDHVRRTAVCIVGASVAFVLLLFGSLLPTGVVGTSALASLAVASVLYLDDEKYAAACFAVSAVLAFLVLPVKAPALYFCIYFGWYPLLYALLEKRCRTFLIKLIVICACAETAVLVLLLLARPLGIVLPLRFVLFGIIGAPFGAVVYDIAYAQVYRFLTGLLAKQNKKR